jgi:uncharacterized protein (DUF1697 family)
MALVVFLRGVNVGGNRTFRPKQLAEQLAHLGCVNIGAAGTFVIRKRVAQSTLRREIAARLPFDCRMAMCQGREIINLIEKAPFGSKPPEADVTRFVSVLVGSADAIPDGPLRWPDKGQWLVRVRAVKGRFIIGEYRRNMKTISYLGALDKQFGQAATTRNWNTIHAIAKQLSI